MNWNAVLVVGVVLVAMAMSTQAATGVCRSHLECRSCIEDDACGWCTNDRICKGKDDTAACSTPLVHDHCPSFFNKELAIGTVCIFFGGILTSGGGVGGGGVYIPVLVLILGLSPHVAVPISKITIFGVAVGGFIILSRKRHPRANRPLIDFDIAFMMEPMTLLGSIIGVYMNTIFPTYLLIVFLVLVLGYNAYKTLSKGITLYKEEKRSEMARKVSINASAEAKPLLDPPNQRTSEDVVDLELKEIMKTESKSPFWQMFVLGFMELGMLVFLLLKGGTQGGSIIGVYCGSWQYWLLVVATVPYLFTFSLIAGRYLRQKHLRKVQAGFKYLKEDVQWTYKRTIALPFVFIIAGVAAGFLGIGAGLVVGPIFLEMGIVPQVAVATSSYMILYTAFSTATQFLILGRLPWEFAVWYFFVGMFSAMIGQAGLSEIIRRYKKQAFINFLLGGIIAISVMAMGVLEIITIMDNVKHHVSMGFEGVCVPGAE